MEHQALGLWVVCPIDQATQRIILKIVRFLVDPSGPKLVSCRSPLQFNQFGRRAIPFKSSFVGCHFESPVGWSLTLTDGFQTLGHVSPIRSSFQKRRKKKCLAEFFGYMTACLLFVYFKSQFFARHGVNIFYNQIVFYLNLFPSRANEFSFFICQ